MPFIGNEYNSTAIEIRAPLFRREILRLSGLLHAVREPDVDVSNSHVGGEKLLKCVDPVTW